MKKIPERLYYPIPEAAEYLGCSVRDIYHFCATGMLNMSIYLNGISDDDAGFMSVDLGSYGHAPSLDGKAINIVNDYSGIYGIHYKDDKHHLLTAFDLYGIFSVPSVSCILLELSNDEFISIGRVDAYGTKGDGEDEVSIIFSEFVDIPRSYLCIRGDDIKNITKPTPLIMGGMEHSRTSNRKGEIIPALLKMIPEFSDVDVDTEKACKLADILEATAASKGIELQMPDKNTWAKYLGRK